MSSFADSFIEFAKETIVNERPIFGDYIDEYEYLIDSAIESFYNDYSGEMNEEFSDRVEDMPDNEVREELREEYAHVLIRDYLDTDELTDRLRENCDLSLIYTSDVFDFYRDNMEDCEDALNELGGAGQFDSISDALSYAVTYAREQHAVSELEEYLDSIYNALI